MKTIAARFDDWMNPIAVKELRQAVRGKFVMVALILSLLAQLVTVAVLAISNALDGTYTAAGPVAYTVIFSVVFTAAVFFVPGYSGFRMAAERSDANVDLLFITTIRPRTIVLGKVWAVAGIVGLIFSASLPFLVFSYVLRGVDFVTILVQLAIAMLVVVSHSITALFIGALPTSRPFKILLALGFFLGTFGLLASSIAMIGGTFAAGPAMIVRSPDFWPVFVTFVVSLIALDAVLLVLTTAMITPAAANRALPIRVMITVAILVSFGGALWGANKTRGADVLTVWAIGAIALTTLVLLSATSERESWGARVARTIPRNLLTRALAFLFYSGGAGGTLWALLMYAATLGLFYGGVAAAGVGAKVKEGLMIHYFADAALAMLAYAMSGVLLRRKVIRRVPASRTWGLVVALFLVLTVIPPVAILWRDAESMDWSIYVHVTTIANPFPTAQRPEEWRYARTIFLGVWAALAAAANAPWFASQVRAFKPLTPKRRDPEAPQPVGELAAE